MQLVKLEVISMSGTLRLYHYPCRHTDRILWLELPLLYFDDGFLEVGDHVLVDLFDFVYIFELARWLAQHEASLARPVTDLFDRGDLARSAATLHASPHQQHVLADVLRFLSSGGGTASAPLVPASFHFHLEKGDLVTGLALYHACCHRWAVSELEVFRLRAIGDAGCGSACNRRLSLVD